MADPVGNAVNTVENAGRTAWGTIKSTFNGAVRIAKPLVISAGLVTALSFAMNPALLTVLANNMATQEAATTLAGAVAQGAGNALNYLGTGIANSDPVWEAGGEAISSAAEGLGNWWGGVDFTPEVA